MTDITLRSDDYNLFHRLPINHPWFTFETISYEGFWLISNYLLYYVHIQYIFNGFIMISHVNFNCYLYVICHIKINVYLFVSYYTYRFWFINFATRLDVYYMYNNEQFKLFKEHNLRIFELNLTDNKGSMHCNNIIKRFIV